MKLLIGNAARRALRSIGAGMQQDIIEAVLDLEHDPFPHASEELEDYRNYRKLKLPPYRILYRVGTSAVYVFQIDKRSNATYRRFNPEC